MYPLVAVSEQGTTSLVFPSQTSLPNAFSLPLLGEVLSSGTFPVVDLVQSASFLLNWILLQRLSSDSEQ